MTQRRQFLPLYQTPSTNQELVNSAKWYVVGIGIAIEKGNITFKASPSPPKSTRQTQASYQCPITVILLHYTDKSNKKCSTHARKYVHEVQELPRVALSSPCAELYTEQLSNIAHPRQTCRRILVLVAYIPNTEGGGNMFITHVLIELYQYELKYWCRLFKRGFMLKIRNYPHLITLVHLLMVYTWYVKQYQVYIPFDYRIVYAR